MSKAEEEVEARLTTPEVVVDDASPPEVSVSRIRSRASAGWACTVGGTSLALATALFRQNLHVGSSGLAAALPVPWYLGMVLVVVGLILAWSESATQMAAATMAIVLTFALTTAIVYPEPRYVWAAKHVGVVQYIRLHHSVDVNIDIYQAWPGLFAGVAWLCDVAGVRDPMTLARWWPVFSDLSGLVLVRLLASRMIVDTGGPHQPRHARHRIAATHRCWLAGLFFALGSDAFGQDYFSPQSIALLLALFVFCLTVRSDIVRPRVARWLLWAGTITAIAVTHQITPYLVCLSLGVLVVFGFVRPWWVALPPGLVGAAWAVVHLASWKKYIVGSQVGKVATNFELSHPNGAYARASIVLVGGLCLAIGGLAVGLLALGHLAGERTRWTIAVAACAASPVVLVAVTSYYGEGVNRVIIFALPWLSILAAALTIRYGMLRNVLPIAVAPLLSATYLVGVGGLDTANTYTPAAIAADRAFERVAPPGAALVIAGSNFPIKSGARYNRFNYFSLQPPYDHRPHLSPYQLASYFTTEMVTLVKAHQYYVVFGPPSENYDNLYGFSATGDTRAFAQGMAQSPRWKDVFSSDGVFLYLLVH